MTSLPSFGSRSTSASFSVGSSRRLGLDAPSSRRERRRELGIRSFAPPARSSRSPAATPGRAGAALELLQACPPRRPRPLRSVSKTAGSDMRSCASAYERSSSSTSCSIPAIDRPVAAAGFARRRSRADVETCPTAIVMLRASDRRSRPRSSRLPASDVLASARIETSIWSSVGSRVVRRWSQRPGASSGHQDRVVRVLPAKRMSSYAIPAITGRSRIRVAISHVPGGLAEEREDEDRDHHDPEQERGPAAQVDEAVALHALGLELLARLVRVDRLVLGSVVLEDAPEVGQERDQDEVEDEDA